MIAPPEFLFAPEKNDPVVSRGSLGSRDERPVEVSAIGLDELPYFQAACEPKLPDHLEIAGLRDGRIRVLQPIGVEISRDGDLVTVQIPEIDEYGQGASLGEAIEDLQRGVAELLLTLEEERESLGSDLEQVRQWLLARLEIQSTKPA